MICYQLVCKKSHAFEGWFRDSAAFDKQSKKGLLSCPTCNSKSVTKAPMAPAISRKADLAAAAERARVLREWATKVRQHVEANSEYVGDRFPDEARAIHHGDAAERLIHGEASLSEAQDLIDEGIPVAPLPVVPHGDS